MTEGEGVVDLEHEFEKTVVSCLNRKLRDVQSQEQTLELRLPDGMPDIGSVLGAWGQCILRGKEWRSSEIGVSGGVTVWVLYQPTDGSSPQSVEAWLPMQQKWALTDSQREGVIRTHWHLKSVDARALSVRKLMLRASVQVLAEVLEPMDVQVPQPIDLPPDIQLLRNQYPALVPKEAGEKTFQIEDVLPLANGGVTPEKILYCQVTPMLTEQKIVGGKGVFRGNVRCHVLYQGEDGGFHIADPELSFGQFEELERDYAEGTALSVMMDITGFEPELQNGQLLVKCGLTAQYVVYDRIVMDLVEDAYSPIRNVSVTAELLNLPNILNTDRKILQSEVECSESRILDAVAYSEYPGIHRAGDLTQMEFSGTVQVLAYNEEGDLEGQQLRWSDNWELPVDPGVQIQPQILSMASPQISAGRIMTQLEAQADIMSPTLGKGVTALEAGEPMTPDSNRPSVILRRAGDSSLWNLAKQTGSTVDAILAANQLTQEPVDDRILLIPIS